MTKGEAWGSPGYPGGRVTGEAREPRGTEGLSSSAAPWPASQDQGPRVSVILGMVPALIKPPSPGNTISMPTASGAKKRFWIIEDMSPFGKRRKTASSRKMLDEGMMLEGFRRFDLYEDCKDAACQFSLKVTHYHCTRENCGYKFCGRTHMYKHAQHHDRVDNLVLDDFKRFKASLSCHFADCPFSGSSTHFHCLRCRFRCTDSTKVTAHRKHHGKQDVISAAGFCQFSSSADCAVPDCKYKLKCSHFHCTYPGCRHTVVGMSQMDSHKRKHEKQERGEPPAASRPEGSRSPPRRRCLDGAPRQRPSPPATLLFLPGRRWGRATTRPARRLGAPSVPPRPPSGGESPQEDDEEELELNEEVDDDDDDEEDDEEEDDDEDDDEDDEDLRTDWRSRCPRRRLWRRGRVMEPGAGGLGAPRPRPAPAAASRSRPAGGASGGPGARGALGILPLYSIVIIIINFVRNGIYL
uniref:C2H2-type domain-containing protein n=1 Tax=Bos mutus grunniens TaxID=30521 RepID=A0A8B9XDL3_BOSMU